MDPTRRDLLAAALAAPLAGADAETMPARDGVRVVLLGTKGGPTPSPDRAAPATLIMVGSEAWLVDCGNGTARQLARAGIALPRVSNIFITHNHSDHVIDVGALIVLAWASGLAHELAVHGPPPLAAIVARSLAACEYDEQARHAPGMAADVRGTSAPAHDRTKCGGGAGTDKETLAQPLHQPPAGSPPRTGEDFCPRHHSAASCKFPPCRISAEQRWSVGEARAIGLVR
jgi:hypothetical protein